MSSRKKRNIRNSEGGHLSINNSSDIDPWVEPGELTPSDEQHRSEISCGLCDPKKRAHRFFILFFMLFISFGTYFYYEVPAALQDDFLVHMHMNFLEFTLIFSIYSLPNIFVGFIGGFLIDRVFGIRLGTIIFCSIVTVGQIIFATGAFLNNIWILYLGRFIFGLGGGTTAVAGSTYGAKWFSAKEVNFVFGLQISIARLGSSVCMLIMHPVFLLIGQILPSSLNSGSQALGVTLFLTLLTCLYSLFCTLFVGFFDKRADRILNRQKVTGFTNNISY